MVRRCDPERDLEEAYVEIIRKITERAQREIAPYARRLADMRGRRSPPPMILSRDEIERLGIRSKEGGDVG